MLTADLILSAYVSGFFPMADSRDGPIAWYSPDPRCILPLDGFRAPRSLRQVDRKNVFCITTDKDFPGVIRKCAIRSETWISPEIEKAYTELQNRGFAHSVEAWKDGELVGGLYGVAIGAAFFGESMFSHAPNASKVCLLRLVRLLTQSDFRLLDSQIINDHIRQFGALEITREDYLKRLGIAVAAEPRFPVPALATVEVK